MTSLPRSDFSAPRAAAPARKPARSAPKDYGELRPRHRLTFSQVMLMAILTAVLVFLLMPHVGSQGKSIRAGGLESLLANECISRLHYANLANDPAEEALVLTRPGCGEEGLAVSVYGMINGQIAPIWGSAQEPALVLSGEVSVTDEGHLLVQEIDPESPLNKSGFLPHPQIDRHSVYKSVAGGFAPAETWYEPVLLGEVQGTGGCLNIRAAANTAAAVVGCIQDGERIKISGGPQTSGGMTWWMRGEGEWVAGTYLKLFAGPDPARPSRATAPQ